MQENKKETLLTFWKRLVEVTQLSFTAVTKNANGQGWNGKGKGDVSVIKQSDYCLLFQEKGLWHGDTGVETNFTNAFRWTLDLNAEVISLEHLHRGPNHPVFLFNLSPFNNHTLSSLSPHLCGSDSYSGQLHLRQQGLQLSWRVIGSKKNEELETLYTGPL